MASSPNAVTGIAKKVGEDAEDAVPEELDALEQEGCGIGRIIHCVESIVEWVASMASFL